MQPDPSTTALPTDADWWRGAVIYQIYIRSLADGDLLEGIRAQVVDKDRRPLWRDAIDGVTEAQAAAMLAPLPVDWPMPGA